MSISLSFANSRRLSAWLLGVVLLLAALSPQVARATHIRAGDIQSNVDPANPNHIFFKLTMYVDPTQFNQTSVTIFYGDNTRQDNIPRRDNTPVPGRPDVNLNTFYFDHVYGGSNPNGYVVSFIGENRVANVQNINGGNSVGQTFYIYSRIFIDPSLGNNHSPVLTAPAVDGGTIGQIYKHDPAVFDADGDSIAVTKLESYQVAGGMPPTGTVFTPTVCTNYVFPDARIGGVTPTQSGSTTLPAFYQQSLRGLVTWNAPAVAGYYNVAMKVEEWRRYPKNLRIPNRLIGIVIRDMQILIGSSLNLPPQLTVPADLCVQAGQPVTLTVSAIDGQQLPNSPATVVTLQAYSGIIPPATFTTTTSGLTTTGTFRWTPDCSNIAALPTIVVFKAQDSPPSSSSNPPLVDVRPVNITVVGPSPKNLRVTVAPTTTIATLNWDTYACTNASQLLIFRREGCYAYNPGNCDTGLPAGSGYVQVGAVSPTTTTYSEQLPSRGVSYSYRIYAVFPLPAGGTSIVSNEACIQLSGRSSLLTNVDVLSTSTTTGQISVKWTQPRTDNGADFTPEYGYRLSRAEGNSTNFQQILERKNSLKDTAFVDTGLNTTNIQYTYRLVFYRTVTSNGTSAESPDPAVTASSVRTSLVANGNANSITVNWAYQVPWDNSKLPTQIYRRQGLTGTYAPIATTTPGATSGTYVDTDRTLQRNQTYYYYVRTTGRYATPINSKGGIIFDNLLNRSQETFAILRPTPCTPVLSLRPVNCDSLAGAGKYFPENQTYQNLLTWTVGNTPSGCQDSVRYYRIYRADTQAGPFVLLDSTAQTSYLNRQLTRSTYCYQVQAVSYTGERSERSNIACQSDCVFFLLPNIFTPNGDGQNDVFRPKTSSPITRTHIKIFNRWGREVYESSLNPYIEWKGDGTVGENSTGGPLADGIYYYLAEVQFADAAQTQRVFKGWVELIR
ncbi:MAG: T9SS type B sorting domain-containing protein [Hymenobacter sp.]|nr:MAG: T9SS type B sorting domain-containing protein [Hymenobacter sp.]